MNITAIAARSANNVMGADGQLPWPHNRQDLKWFKTVTNGDPMIMGRKTLLSLPGVLPNRPHFVITSTVQRLTVNNDGVALLPLSQVNTLLQQLEDAGRKNVFLVGGAQLFEALGHKCNMLLLRTFDAEYAGDVMFPQALLTNMRVIATERWSDSITEIYKR